MESVPRQSRRMRTQAAVAAVQLACGLAGLAVALRRRHTYDFFGFRGSPEKVARDATWMGTAFSAPGPMLVAQSVLTPRALLRGDPRAARGLQLLGAAMTVGYTIERQVRSRLRREGFDAVETPLAVAGWSLAVAMVLLGPGRRSA